MLPCTRLGGILSRAVVLLLLAGLLAGCRRQAAGKTPTGAGARSMAIVYTCDTQGYIFPCDCEGGAEGGIARRAGFLGEQPATNRILVDAGDFVAGARDWEILQAKYLLRGYALMKYDAVNLGHREAALGAETLKALQADYGRLVSANLVDAQGRPVVNPYRVVRLGDGTRVGIIGIMDDSLPQREIGKGLAILPPDSAVGRYLPELRKQSDVVVLLAFADEETMLNLANLFYEVSVIVGGKVRQPTTKPLRMNQAVVVAVSDKGKNVGRLNVEISGKTVSVQSNSVTALTHAFADDPAAARIQQDYQSALKAQDFVSRKSFVDDREGLTEIDARKKKEKSP